MRKKVKIKILSIIILLLVLVIIGFFSIKKAVSSLDYRYENLFGSAVIDRNDVRIINNPNPRGYYASQIDYIPERFAEILINKEDQQFWIHSGVNPKSIIRATSRSLLKSKKSKGSSTITQQLVKILLGNENERTIKNKIKELFYSFALEFKYSKKEILLMYINSIYFGNQIQGLYEASHYYFDTSPMLLQDSEIIQLLSSISSPTKNNPTTNNNISLSIKLAKNLKLEFTEDEFRVVKRKDLSDFSFRRSSFELEPFLDECPKKCHVTIDEELSDNLSKILEDTIFQLNLKKKKVDNGSLVVIDASTGQVLSMVGSKDIKSNFQGNQINMTIKPRAIGSTIKPLLYLKGFELGLRPYSLVDDREYRFEIRDGFSFYPKNYNLEYNGPVSLEYSLANSLNVPSVQVLRYIGQDHFNHFLLNNLEIKPVQSIENYELAIALGGFEMNLLNLTHVYTLFANDGLLPDLQILSNDEKKKEPKKVADKKYVQMINAILSERTTGSEQFGAVSHLNLPAKNYALKTGTSQHYKDSWIIGYTPDFVVGVWLGNADNSETDALTGSQGAGYVFAGIMEYLLQTTYNTGNDFATDELTNIEVDNNSYYTPSNEKQEDHRFLIFHEQLLLFPHDKDIYKSEKGASITLKASEKVDWFINNQHVGTGENHLFNLDKTGSFNIRAHTENQNEEVTILVNENKK